MASLPNPKTVTYEEWLRMPEVANTILLPANARRERAEKLRRQSILAESRLKPRLFPVVAIPIAEIWPD